MPFKEKISKFKVSIINEYNVKLLNFSFKMMNDEESTPWIVMKKEFLGKFHNLKLLLFSKRRRGGGKYKIFLFSITIF